MMTQERHVGHHGHSGSEVFIREWREDDTFNSFNNWKGLLYAPHYKRIAERGELLPPVEARIDLTLKCNLNCAWCNSAVYRRNGDKLDGEFVYRLIDVLADWGVKSICWAGGGEPTIHPEFTQILIYARVKGLASGLLSNGTHLNDYANEIIGGYTRWAGISVDAGTAETYKRAKGKDYFDKVIHNLQGMVTHSSNCNVGYKFLISPLNQGEILKACEKAKGIGVRDFVARPMDTLHQGMKNHDTTVEQFDRESVFAQFEACHGLATDDFHVYTVMHKFNPDFTHSKSFSQCYGAPLKVHIAPSTSIYFCDDQFYQPKYCLGALNNDPKHIREIWGSERHKEMIYGDTPSRCKTRCCVGDYNIQCERLFVNTDDPMCAEFP